MLKLTDVNSYYGHVHALKGISINVEDGKIVALLGSNGAGKTTTLRTISGMLHPRSGYIEFLGQRVEKFPPEKLVSMGIVHVPEGRQIFPELTAMENLKIGTYVRKDKNNTSKDLEWVFSLFPRLKERINQLGGTLSGGEQQMLAIARGLMARPKLLLLDEPSLGLAPLIVKEIFNIIKQINSDGVTVLLVEQNARKALQISDYAYVLQTGIITMEGSADEVSSNEEIKRSYLGH